jgi:hypothetical protein
LATWPDRIRYLRTIERIVFPDHCLGPGGISLAPDGFYVSGTGFVGSPFEQSSVIPSRALPAGSLFGNGILRS